MIKNQEIDLDGDDLILTREWRLKDGKYKSRSRVNGVLINRNQVKLIREYLIDFTFQGDHYFTNDSYNPINLLNVKCYLLQYKECGHPHWKY